ncbi:MAG: hypothetical protein ISR55_07240 [Bacteroidetes bacterium]|nr:hypothetical protein [Bacteroidota bacterium]
MKLITTYYLIFIFLCAGYSSRSQDTLKSYFDEGKALEDAGALTDAYIFYERIAFEANDPLLVNMALMSKAAVLKRKGEYLKAQRSLERLNYAVLNDSMHFHARYETALCAYLSANYYDAISQFEQLNFYLHDSNLIIQTIPLQVLVYNEIQNWKHAKELLLIYKSNTRLSVAESLATDELISFYNKKHIPKLKKVKTAQWMSAFLPGAGQIYAGNIGEGLLNFTFTFASLGIAGIAFYYKYFFTGYFAGLALFQKFYFGSNKRVEYLVNKRNYLNTRAFNDEVKKQLIIILNK